MKISKDLSAYLDLVRFVAALCVVLGHLNQDGIAIGWVPLTHFSHEAVVVFFVLSGFIICSNAQSTNITARSYAVARISRIYSVALPAVGFSFLAAWAIEQLALPRPSGYRPFAWDDLFSSVVFLNESWNNPAQLTLNNLYWSLCYEVWFYVLFGLFLFLRGRTRWLWCVLAALLAGPAVLTLFPLWLMGAWATSLARRQWRMRTTRAWTLFLLAPVLMIAVHSSGLDVAIRDGLRAMAPQVWRLDNSQRFLSDYVLGLAVMANLLAFPSLPAAFRAWLGRHQDKLSSLAGFSFSLYLFHRPMTQIVGAYRPLPAPGGIQSIAIALAIIMACWVLAAFTERQLPAWRRATDALFRMVARARHGVPAPRGGAGDQR